MRGNVIYLAIGFVIGAAFAALVNFSDLFISLDGQNIDSLADAQDAGAATINYSFFVNAVTVFLVLTFVILLIIQALKRI